MFGIGQKVVVVNDGYIAANPPFKNGEICTVADISYTGALRLAEYFGAFDGIEYWTETRFRPVVERKTDISIFQAMLTPSPVTVDAIKIADHAREIVG